MARAGQFRYRPRMDVDNNAFTAEQRTEAFRREVMAEMVRLRKAAETTRLLVILVLATVAYLAIARLVEPYF